MLTELISTGANQSIYMTNVLVTGAGGTGGVAMIQVLQKSPEFRVVAVDMNPLSAGLYMADIGEVVPVATAENWTKEMRKIIQRHNVEVAIPLVEEELARLGELRKATPDTAFVAPENEVIDVCLDKYELMSRLESAAIPVPTTWPIQEATELAETEFPIVVKPRSGRGGRGVSVIESTEELSRYRLESELNDEELMAQEHICGREFTSSVVCTRSNDVLSVVPKEAKLKIRSTVHGITRRQDRVVDTCRAIANHLKPAGPINVQQILDGSGTPRTIEVNPRFSSSACLTVAAGVDEVSALVRDAIGDSYQLSKDYRKDLHMIRYTDQTFVTNSVLLDDGAKDEENL